MDKQAQDPREEHLNPPGIPLQEIGYGEYNQTILPTPGGPYGWKNSSEVAAARTFLSRGKLDTYKWEEDFHGKPIPKYGIHPMT